MATLNSKSLMCDRCNRTIVLVNGGPREVLQEMSSWFGLNHSHVSGTDHWDLCPQCALAFVSWIKPSDPEEFV